jgi:lysozyme family protein
MADHKKQVNFIKKWEGGISNDPRDIGPASFPAPCVYQGQVGWHTNKGIIYRTFSSNASKLGYTPSCENFIQMPDYIWLKIYKLTFWDKFLLDQYKSQSIADIIVSLAWGSGIGGAYRQLAKFLNKNYGTSFSISTSGYSMTNAIKFRDIFQRVTKTASGEKKVQEKLIEHLRQFYISLNNPTYIKGWLNRVNALNEFTYASLRAVNRNWQKLLLMGTGAIGIAVGIYFLVDYLIKNESAARKQKTKRRKWQFANPSIN